MTNMRIIMCAKSTSKLIAPIKSRCLLMRVAAPNDAEVRGLVDQVLLCCYLRYSTRMEKQMNACLQYVAKMEKFDLPPDTAQEIVVDSGGNLRKALLVLEALKMQSFVSLSLAKFHASNNCTILF